MAATSPTICHSPASSCHLPRLATKGAVLRGIHLKSPGYAAMIPLAASDAARLRLQLSRPVSPSHCSLPAQLAQLLQLPAGSPGRMLPGAWECPACGRCRLWECPAGCGLYTSREQVWSVGPAVVAERAALTYMLLVHREGTNAHTHYAHASTRISIRATHIMHRGRMTSRCARHGREPACVVRWGPQQGSLPDQAR